MRTYEVVAVTALGLAVVTVPAFLSARSSQAPSAELFAPGTVSTALDELNSVFTRDGRELYYSINTPGDAAGAIVVSRLHNGRWSPPETVSFSGRYSDYDPFFSADERQLYFISNRPRPGTTSTDYDVYVVERAGSGWGEPRNLGAPVNTSGDEYYPSVAADGTLYFSASREGGQGSFDLYRSRLVDGRYSEPENLGADVNGRAAEIDSYVAPDQSYIIFASYGRPESIGNGDLYISHMENGRWTPARNLGPLVNSAAREYCPIVSPDGKYFYWTSKRGFADQPWSRRLSMAELRDSLGSIRNGGGNIYRVPLALVMAIR